MTRRWSVRFRLHIAQKSAVSFSVALFSANLHQRIKSVTFYEGTMIPLKRRKVVPTGAGNTGSEETSPNKFPQVVLFLLERKMGASRRAFLSQLGRKKGFQVEELFSPTADGKKLLVWREDLVLMDRSLLPEGRDSNSVCPGEGITHVICENNSGDEVIAWLESQVRGRGRATAHLLDVSWFTESMRAGRPVEILDRHQLQQQQIREVEVVVFSAPSYACQRRTTLDNHNAILTDALSLLAENAELSGEDGRGVAFRRAAGVLKGLPEPVTAVTQLVGLPCLGGHSLRVVKDILENGASCEVEDTKQSERFKVLKVLTGIFGVGVKTAERWIQEGIRGLQQLQDSGRTLNRAQQAGLQHYEDLNQHVTRSEADAVAAVVEEAVASVLPGARMTLIGGFRRGKLTGHDVDFLITHPEEGREVGLMPKVVSWLESQGFLLYQKTTKNSYLEGEDGPARPSSNMDRFERCFSIFKLTEEVNGEGLKPWRAVRVDLVVSPISQFAFALLGWTGSKLFERELRRWAGHKKAMSLSSHALYDNTQRRYLRASSEEEIFAHLGLEYIPPSERNA